ncbi:hypothetical protein E3N88_09579 [Mikania micrantha]|uniref:Uncharacterized protein n=1 Tax=Mikania micrantha TaxID=192012 RepID=A0A5N6PLR1_9ASTR|nr:hypothetical protein E3N88_09579 [Mikania micrantha]
MVREQEGATQVRLKARQGRGSSFGDKEGSVRIWFGGDGAEGFVGCTGSAWLQLLGFGAVWVRGPEMVRPPA